VPSLDSHGNSRFILDVSSIECVVDSWKLTKVDYEYEHRFAEHEHEVESSSSIAPQHAAVLVGSDTSLTAYPMVMDPPIPN
jgi:hypothetical protein